MPQIFYVTANENARYKRNELEWIFYGSFQLSKKHTMEESLALNLGDLDLTSDDAWLDEVDGKIVWRRMS